MNKNITIDQKIELLSLQVSAAVDTILSALEEDWTKASEYARIQIHFCEAITDTKLQEDEE